MQSSEGPSEDAEKALEETLRTLAKNMSEISRGGGKPDELVEQIVKVAEALIAFDAVYGVRPHEELVHRALANRWSTDK